jgi:hypothetical protein
MFPDRLLEFENVSPRQAGKWATELEDALKVTVPTTTVERSRDDQEAQDFGATLVLVFGTPVAVALAKGIAQWMNRHDQASITVKTPEGEIVARGLNSRDVPAIAKALQIANTPK